MESVLAGSCEIEFGDTSLILLPSRAVFWESESTVFIADTHFGKAETFHHLNIPVPSQIDEDLMRLSKVLNETQCEHLIVLGDLVHSRKGNTAQLKRSIADWRAQHREVTIQLVRGNHDKASGEPCSTWAIESVDAPCKMGALHLTHHPAFKSQNWTLCGHLHPKFRITNALEDIRCPAFLKRNQTLVLPAFAKFVDHGIVPSMPYDIFYAIADSEVIPINV